VAGALKVPQANDIVKIMDIPLAIANGNRTLPSVANRYSFDRRQALYYLDASELLGFIKRTGKSYALTERGQKYLEFEQPERRELLARSMLSTSIVHAILVELVLEPKHRLSRKKIELMAASGARISGTTVVRRTQTLLKWFEWLGKETRSFRTTAEGLILTTSRTSQT
jgi:hypothetical protein